MGKIKTLPSDLVSKIAAGQVVERPASVVKELVENSIDAKSKNISIEIELSGKKRITVIDDGEGMDEEDLKKCFLPHSTSKIFDVEDLDRVKSMGFRGEALHSISSVAKISIKSRIEATDIGNLVEVEGGKFKKMIPTGMAVGTVVTVSNLFENIPARRKFLKSDDTEFKHIFDFISRLAMANPDIGFKLFNDGNLVLNLRNSQNFFQRIEALLGETTFSRLLQFELVKDHIKVWGFVSKPQFSTTSNLKQFFL